MTAKRSWLALAAAVVLAVLLWWVQGTADPAPDTGPDPDGLSVVALADLPPEAAQTVDLIDAGGPYPHDQDDGVFQNREEILPDRPDGLLPRVHRDDPGVRRPRGTEDRGRQRWRALLDRRPLRLVREDREVTR